MVEQKAWKQCATTMTLLGLVAVFAGCANAYAQSAPDGGAASTGNTSAASDGGAATGSTGAASDGGAATASSDGGSGSSTTSTASSPPPSAYTGPEPWFNLRNNPQQLHVGAGIGTPFIVRVVHRNQAALSNCYKSELAADAHAHGVLTVRLQVIAGGVGTIDRVRFQPRNENLERCVRRVFQDVTWPNPRGVPATEIEMEFDLAPTPPPPPPRH